MRWGSCEGTLSSKSTLLASAPPDSPVKATIVAPRVRPASTPRKILGLLPLVERATSTSFAETSDSIWREKIWSKPKSLSAAGRTDGFAVRGKEGETGRGGRKRTNRSGGG